ncbi:MAG: zeta toxin family protein [Opitutaceae bacterium]|nr:zeta toxin family protein [Cytophagales bacterium]
MKAKNLYIIAGCNGAGKTTASFNILPEILGCKEFVNADEIARGISPFQPEKVAIEAGRIMLNRIRELMNSGVDFALETTLSSLSYQQFIKEAQSNGYYVTLLYFWLETPQLAIERVAKRVASGGHHIPKDVIERRYIKGISNLFSFYVNICDYSQVYDNSQNNSILVYRKRKSEDEIVFDQVRFNKIKNFAK